MAYWQAGPLQVLQVKTKNAVDILETSFILKKTRFVSREGDPQPIKGGRAPEDVEHIKNFFTLFWYSSLNLCWSSKLRCEMSVHLHQHRHAVLKETCVA